MSQVRAEQGQVDVVDIWLIRIHDVICGRLFDVVQKLVQMRDVGREILEHFLYLNRLILSLRQNRISVVLVEFWLKESYWETRGKCG